MIPDLSLAKPHPPQLGCSLVTSALGSGSNAQRQTGLLTGRGNMFRLCRRATHVRLESLVHISLDRLGLGHPQPITEAAAIWHGIRENCTQKGQEDGAGHLHHL